MIFLSEDNKIFGIDLGGTNLRIALANENGEILQEVEEKVDTSSKGSISAQMIKIINEITKKNNIEKKELKGIGIASTGPLNIKKGELIHPSNLPFEKVPLKTPLEKELKVSVRLLNDCTAAVLGEKMFGAGKNKDLDNIVYINIGTGIGGGVIVDGHLLIGKNGNAAEIGHFTVDPEERLKCGCGKMGHWEAYCSGKNLPNFIRAKLKEEKKDRLKKSSLYGILREKSSNMDAESFFEAVKSNDQLSRDILEEINFLNSLGFANVTDAYDPSLITVGGSVALRNEKEIISPLKKKVKKHVRNIEPEILKTPLGEDIGLYGAIASVIE